MTRICLECHKDLPKGWKDNFCSVECYGKFSTGWSHDKDCLCPVCRIRRRK